MKFGIIVRLKPSNNGGEFELDRARSNNNIAENSFALGHETDKSSVLCKSKYMSVKLDIFEKNLFKF